MKSTGFAWSIIVVAAVSACGGSKKEPATATSAPTSSASAPAQSATTRPDMPSSATTAGPVSDEVTKGIKALDAGDLVAAKAYFDAALRKNARDVDALYYLGYTAEKSGDKMAAAKAYKDALKVRGDYEGAAVNLTGLMDEAQQYDDAAIVAQKALNRHPDNASLHLNLGIALAGKADQPGATKEFDQAVSLSGNDPMFHLVYGHWLGAWKLQDAARTQLRAARPLAADNVGVLAAIGHELHLIHDFDDCVPTFDKAIAIKDAAELRTERAACKIGANDTAGALADLQSAVATDANYAPAHYYLGGELARGGQFKQAVAEYQAFLKLEPNGPLAKAANDKIRLAKQKMGK
jgi:tetratricopeptide (TPR) repeat protein